MKRLHSLIGLGFLSSTASAFVVIQESKALRTKEELSAFVATSTPSSRFPYKENNALDAREYTVSSQTTTASDYRYSWSNFVLPVLGASFLITGNTVGAGYLVMPELAAGPGLAATSGIFAAAYLVNLMSGLLLAQVAIHQRETSSEDVPASFQEFAEANLKSPLVANGIAAVSIFVNGCVQAYDVSRAGVLGVDYLGMDAGTVSCLWAALAAVVVGTQSTKNVSQVSSVCVTLLFATFAALVIPGIAAVTDPIGTWTAPGTNPETAMDAAPVILMAMIYQNIVPTVVKLLDYDRAKVAAALITGSFIPLVMYLSWCYASLGGGIEGELSGIVLSAFSVFAIAGSTLGTSLSLSQEVKNFVPGKDIKADAEEEEEEGSNWIAASASLGVPLVAALTFSGGSGFTEALSLAGSFGSPLLYGIIPVAMVWKQQQDQVSNRLPAMVPNAALPVLGSLSAGFVAQGLLERFNEVATTFV